MHLIQSYQQSKGFLFRVKSGISIASHKLYYNFGGLSLAGMYRIYYSSIYIEIRSLFLDED